MDDHRFDALTRRVARRGALKGGAGFALSALAAAFGLDEAVAAKRRSPGNGCRTNADCASGRCVAESRFRKVCGCTDPAESLCQDGCVDLERNNANCGTCGHACDNDKTCIGGQCHCADFRKTLCAGMCVDTRGDKHNCGACGHRCPVGNTQGCVDGVCQPCPKGQYVCQGQLGCHDLLSDPANCNGCGAKCANVQLCVDGACRCPDGQTLCGDRGCVDLQTSDDYCGSCDTHCKTAAGEVCRAGQCVCADPLLGQCPDGCFDLQTTATHCGDCGNACVRNAGGVFCQGGHCVCADPRDTYCPSIGCVDLQRISYSCGSCGNVCKRNEVCLAGKCACPESQDTQCPDGCFVLESDPANCGACGNVCLNSGACVKGVCPCPSGQAHCGTSGACCAAEACCNGACCPAGGLCCPSAVHASSSGGGGTPPPACVDAQTDAANCGACGVTCGRRQKCVGGICQNLPCLELGEAATLASDCCSGALGGHPDSGQFCACAAGATCPGPRDPATGAHLSAICCADGTFCAEDAAGGSGLPACCAASGLVNCGAATCLDLQGDPTNCGVCGKACPSGHCVAGVCPCPNGQADCPVGYTCITSATQGPICVFTS